MFGTKRCVTCNQHLFVEPSPLDYGGISEHDMIAANKKLLGRSINKYFCIKCLAEYLGCEPEDVASMIRDFKSQGCQLF